MADSSRSQSGLNAPIHNDPVQNGIRLLGETVVMPGASLILDGKIGEGAIHAVLGLAAKALLGPPVWMLIAANSYSKCVSGRNLYEHVMGSSGSAGSETSGPTGSGTP